MFSNLSPSYLSDLVPQSVNTISHYNLRNDLESVASGTNQYYNSFLPSVVREWNDLTNDVRQSDSLHSLKYNLNRERTMVPKHFYSNTRKAQILHTRLRTNCRSLNNDLYLKNSPLCCCGAVENTNHFFLQCSYYNEQRTKLLHSVALYQTVTLKLLHVLFGDGTLPLDINISIFNKVHKDILDTKRFT